MANDNYLNMEDKKNDVWLKEAKIISKNTGGYQVHAKFNRRIIINPDEDVGHKFERKNIEGVDIQLYETGFQALGVRECQLQFFVPELGTILNHIKDLPIKKEYKEEIKKAGKVIWSGYKEAIGADK